jgi:2-polyprenyl-3-methyl-5-hydroxy-6-metoxy-1,4-benzoquinol methylase
MRHPEQEGTTMSEVQSSAQTYALGHTPEAFQRLLVQGQLFNPFTRRLLSDAGLRAGMHVLDLGCGPGDVSLLAAEVVGEQGSVLGVDTNANVLQIAHARAQAAGLSHVSFLVGSIDELALTQQFDAIVGRLILMYMREPAAVLRQLATHLRPGECWLSKNMTFPLNAMPLCLLPHCGNKQWIGVRRPSNELGLSRGWG